MIDTVYLVRKISDNTYLNIELEYPRLLSKEESSKFDDRFSAEYVADLYISEIKDYVVEEEEFEFEL